MDRPGITRHAITRFMERHPTAPADFDAARKLLACRLRRAGRPFVSWSDLHGVSNAYDLGGGCVAVEESGRVMTVLTREMLARKVPYMKAVMQ